MRELFLLVAENCIVVLSLLYDYDYYIIFSTLLLLLYALVLAKTECLHGSVYENVIKTFYIKLRTFNLQIVKYR